MDRVFLDANVLYSAAWRPALAGLCRLWTLDRVTLMTSTYAIHEAERNIVAPDHLASFHELTRVLTLAEQRGHSTLPLDVRLPPKDWPILLAAIENRATHLLTGDRKHFGRYFDQTLEGVLILPPASYLSTRL